MTDLDTQSGDESEEQTPFIEIDEDDPFVGLQLGVMLDDGSRFVAGGIVPEPGRYELRRVAETNQKRTEEP